MKNYSTLFDLSDCSETEKKYFESMLQEISEVESVKNVLDSLVQNRKKKIRIVFSLSESDCEGESHANDPDDCDPHIRLRKLNKYVPKNFNDMDKDLDFFDRASTLAHEITHFDNAHKIKQIRPQLDIKQALITGFYDEIQAFLVDKDCDEYFQEKYHNRYAEFYRYHFTFRDEAAEYIRNHSYRSRQEACLELLGGTNEQSSFYVDRRLIIALNSRWGYGDPKYGPGMKEEEFYSTLKTMFPKTEYIPKDLSYKWHQKNSDGTYWIHGEKMHMLFDKENHPIYLHLKSQFSGDINYIYSKEHSVIDGFIHPKSSDMSKAFYILSTEEAKAYQSVCGNPFWGLGGPLAPLYFFAVTQSKKVKEILKKTGAHLKKALTLGSSKGKKPTIKSQSEQKQ